MSVPVHGKSRDPDITKATWREWLGLVVLMLPITVLATDATVLFLAMPSITADLRPGTSQMLWILHIYGFLIAGLLITMGRLGDRIGRRRLLLSGGTAFAVFSVIAASSTSAEMLIAARALLGVAGATLMPSAFSLLRAMFRDGGQRRFAIAVMIGAFSGGMAIGPLLGGALLEFFWWGSVFLVNVPALMVLLLLGRMLLPEYREPTGHPLDLPSVALSLAALLSLIYGLQEMAAGQGGEHTSVWPYVGSIAVGTILAVLFVRRQLRLGDPLLDLTLFVNRRFSTSLGAVLLTGIGIVGPFYLLTQYLQWVQGMAPLRAGLWTLPYVVLSVVGSLLAPPLTRRLRDVTVIVVGWSLTAAGLALVAVLGSGGGLPVVLAGVASAGLGHGAAMALASDLIISSAPAKRAGSASAMQEVSGELGAALGVAVGGTAATVAYRAALAGTIPAGVPAATADAARDSVPGALAAAERLPPEVGARLLDAARDAFTQGFQTSSGIGAVFIAVVAVLVAALFRRTTAAAEDPPDVPASSSDRTAEPELKC